MIVTFHIKYHVHPSTLSINLTPLYSIVMKWRKEHFPPRAAGHRSTKSHCHIGGDRVIVHFRGKGAQYQSHIHDEHDFQSPWTFSQILLSYYHLFFSSETRLEDFPKSIEGKDYGKMLQITCTLESEEGLKVGPCGRGSNRVATG